MPNVLFVDHAGVLGGAELYLLDALRAMKSSAHVVLFEDGPFWDLLQEEQLPASLLKASGSMMGVERTGGFLRDLKAIPGVLNLVVALRNIARDYDVVYTNSQKAHVIGSIAGKLAGKPVIWNLHDILTADHFSAVHRRLGVFLANRLVDRVIVNSEATLEAFVDSGGKRELTEIIYNGIDSTRFASIEERDVELKRSELGVTEQYIIGIFSRLSQWKGQHVALQALAHLPGVHLLLVGGALFQDDQDYEIELKSLAKQLAIDDRVHFLGFRSDVPVLMKTVDLVLHTSISPEPFGRVIVEGMFAGKPVIASDDGGAREIITHGENGLLIKPGAPDALVQAVQHLQSNLEETTHIARSGHNSANERFTIEQCTNQIQASIKNVVGNAHVIKYSKTSTTPV